MDFLALALQASFLPVTFAKPPEIDIGAPGCVLRPGEGEPSKSGDIVTVDYCIQSADGKELANSMKRGISQTFVLLKSGGDGLLNVATLGAKVGEVRQVVLLMEEWYSPIGPYRLVQSPGPVAVRIRVTNIDRR
jgi:hypothetical protein